MHVYLLSAGTKYFYRSGILSMSEFGYFKVDFFKKNLIKT